MSTPVAQNPAASDPHKHLTPSQRDALYSIDFYRRQRRLPSDKVMVGPKRFKLATIKKLEELELIRQSHTGFTPTLAGEMAVARLRGEKP